MNARQKAKFYRRKYEQLRRCTQPVGKPIAGVQAVPVVTIRAEQIISTGELNVMPQQAINNMLAAQLLHQLLDFAVIKTIADEHYGMVTIRADMKVVDMSKAGQEDSNGQADKAQYA